MSSATKTSYSVLSGITHSEIVIDYWEREVLLQIMNNIGQKLATPNDRLITRGNLASQAENRYSSSRPCTMSSQSCYACRLWLIASSIPGSYTRPSQDIRCFRSRSACRVPYDLCTLCAVIWNAWCVLNEGSMFPRLRTFMMLLIFRWFSLPG